MAAMVACSDDNGSDYDDASEKDRMLQSAMAAYVDHTVVPTYKGMADYAIRMAEACNAMLAKFTAGSLTVDDVQLAGEYWNESRAYWEKSEAFLYGAAADYNIDPHIDSWPLDKIAMDDLLRDIRNGKSWSIDNNLNFGLLGFHAVEYLLFELSADGESSYPHSLAYTEEELVYLATVAEDLRNQCVRLEAAWAGMDNVTSEKQQLLAEAELEPSFNYGWSMKNAGQGGSVYKSYQDAAEDLVQGCIDIADEVGNTKIGRPANGASSEDKNYIESPYSLNSIVDFHDNIVSIRNAYQGSQDGDASVSDYVKSVRPELDAKVRDQIAVAIAAIDAIPEPFAKNAASAAADHAVTVVGTDLVDVLQEVMAVLSRY